MDVTGTGAVGLDDAFHEAGHAVGAVLRGQRWDADLEAKTEPEAGVQPQRPVPESHPPHRHACDLLEIPDPARAFVAYAGIWALARNRWAQTGAVGEDFRGRTFEDYVADAMLVLPTDAMTVAMAEYDTAALLRQGGADDTTCWRWMRGVHYAWRGELEDVWGVVSRIGAHLAGGGSATGDDISRLTDERLAALYN